ncbi:hypothetical protein [Taibaiella helva]|uniref:hypothetical protein n=1 Tax=Taibaiella helva TaxID=2301235 RepID=UPI000E57C726|nr:hypothetical protein [Taibaiella helva]
MQKEYKLNSSYYIKEGRKWLNALNDLRAENIRLKDQLSEAISREVSLDFVEQADRFQQRFVEKDQVLDLLRHEINIVLAQIAGREIVPADERQYQLLEKDMEHLIHEFHQMKLSFADFLIKRKTG